MPQTEGQKNTKDSQQSDDDGDYKKFKKAAPEQGTIFRSTLKGLKSTGKSSNDHIENQNKITKYISNNSSKKEFSKENKTKISYQDLMDLKIKELQDKLVEKQQVINELKNNKEREQNKFSLLYLEAREYRRKSKSIIAQTMLDSANIKRKQKAQIDPKIGYFKEGTRVFIEGEIFVSLKEQIEAKQKQIHKVQNDRKSNKDLEIKQRSLFTIDFLAKQILQMKKQLLSRQRYATVYKERLKLAQKQQKCQYSRQGWPIVFQYYQTLQLLGTGGFGEVYKSFDINNNTVVALKINKFQIGRDDSKFQEEFIKHVNRQAQIQKQLNHPNIAKLIKLLQCTPNRVSFVLQYCSGPELSTFMKKNTCLQQKQAKMIIKQIINALNYLYSLKQKIIHYDLKPSNVIFHNGVVKILDFGLCKIMQTDQTKMQLTSQGVGTYWYLPPQTFDQYDPKVSSKVDIWSAGVIFYEMLYGKRPFGHGISQNKIYSEGIILKAVKVDFPTETPKKFKVSDSAKQFISFCLKHSVDERLSPKQAYDHAYFKK